jgi:glucosamine-6-phosphate deaminase
MSPAPLHVFDSPDTIGEHLADRILLAIAEARAAGRRFLFGSPTGRTPRPIYSAMASRLSAAPQDLSHLTIVMMDEYLVPSGDGLACASAESPWSCHYFAEHEMLRPWNAALPPAWQIAPDQLWFPNPDAPAEYETRITQAGGIDLFLLASGASDGHVAFNPPGSPRDSRVRIIPLSLETRRDNLQTFPSFGTLDTVPHHGVSVGIATIIESRAAIMCAWGTGKQATISRVRNATAYESDWPATLIHDCARGEIICDRAAAND